jgi:hypothetical protein
MVQPIFLTEMATVGVYDSHKVTVYEETLGNPSFHIKYKNEWEIVLQIRDFVILEVKHGNFKKGDKFPRKEYKDLIKFLNSNDEDLNISNWKYLIDAWNRNNPKYKISTSTQLPIY